MLMLRHHNAHDYATLPDIDETDVGLITVDDQVCLDEVGSCLLRTNVQARFGVTLLHSHFPVYDGEILLEEVNADERLITLRPARSDRSSVFATSICYDDAAPRSELEIVGLEFASSQTLAGVAPINDSDRDALISIAEILRRRAKTKRFGVRLLHDPLGLDGSVLLETSDPIHRILTSRAEVDDLAFLRSVPTVFRWEEVRERNERGPVIDQGCMQYCRTVSRCVQPVHGSHGRSRSHEPTGHESV